jgi:hypothetical protein
MTRVFSSLINISDSNFKVVIKSQCPLESYKTREINHGRGRQKWRLTNYEFFLISLILMGLKNISNDFQFL